MEKMLKSIVDTMSDFLDKLYYVYSSLDPCFVGDSIDDSFTVLVGFVAIGIPLSLQVISRATEKFKSEHLINYLSSWKWVNPKRIYWASIFYFIAALMFKSLLPSNVKECGTLDIQLYAWGVIILFLVIVTVVGLWYGHLFTQAGKRPKEIYEALKK